MRLQLSQVITSLPRRIRPASWPPSDYVPRVRPFASVRKSLSPLARVRETPCRVSAQAREFQRRADRTLFRSRRAFRECFRFPFVVFLYLYQSFAVRLIALTPPSLFIGSS